MNDSAKSVLCEEKIENTINFTQNTKIRKFRIYNLNQDIEGIKKAVM